MEKWLLSSSVENDKELHAKTQENHYVRGRTMVFRHLFVGFSMILGTFFSTKTPGVSVEAAIASSSLVSHISSKAKTSLQ